ncbi:unnamed protein product [Brugia pahangi]|uniref:DDE_Tnp_1_7 domain-containing protein n=1 Tax=Brugia pahangi TaxID=6280 RepID=A0A0N4SWS0_BRUPA|nr:unnamed protein product [Brugia pahangi]
MVGNRLQRKGTAYEASKIFDGSNSNIISENFLMIKKKHGKPAVSSSSKNTISVHLTFYLKTMGDSFIGKLILFPLLKMQNPSDWLESSRIPKCDTAGCKGWYCKNDEHSRNIQIAFKTRYD